MTITNNNNTHENSMIAGMVATTIISGTYSIGEYSLFFSPNKKSSDGV